METLGCLSAGVALRVEDLVAGELVSALIADADVVVDIKGSVVLEAIVSEGGCSKELNEEFCFDMLDEVAREESESL